MSSDLSRQTREQQSRSGQATDRTTALVAKIQGQRTGIAAALADRIGAERFLRAAATEIRTTPKLAECSDDSILGGLYIAAQLGLEVGGPRGLVYLVPYGHEAQLIIGYKGWIDLFYRAGARAVQWFLIREGDQFRIGSDAIRGKVYSWEQADPNSDAPIMGAVAQIVTANGGIVWEYLSRADIDKRSTGSNFWKRWYPEMALKTVMRRLAATAPLSEDLVLAQAADETVQRRVEVPGMPAEQLTEHVPLAGTRPAVEQRPTAPPRPPMPGAPPHPPVPGAPRPHSSDEAPADVPAEPEPAPEPADDDWEAREREEHAAWLAAQQEPETER